MEGGIVCGHWCQALTVHCVKLVIISGLKRCPAPVRSSCLGRPAATDGDLEKAGCVCQGGKSLVVMGVANITASFIDTDTRSDTSKSGPINLQAGCGVTGACEGKAAQQMFV